MRENSLLIILAFACVVVGRSAQADTFGSGANTFTVDFRNIGNAGNVADTTGYGAVVYNYRIGTYEISQDVITRATASGLSNVTAGAWTGSRPATDISWYEAAAFVNWLNTSTGRQAAYNLTFSGSWSMALWNSADAWTLGGTNLYRHKDAYYFLPSENEWYKAAYYNTNSSAYFSYPTASGGVPAAVSGGTNAGTAVYNQSFILGPASVTNAGGLGPNGTMGQGGNAYEWTETAFDGDNDSATEARLLRGGIWDLSDIPLSASNRSFSLAPSSEYIGSGFRVASVPEPSTYALLLLAGAGAALMARRRAKRG